MHCPQPPEKRKSELASHLCYSEGTMTYRSWGKSRILFASPKRTSCLATCLRVRLRALRCATMLLRTSSPGVGKGKNEQQLGQEKWTAWGAPPTPGPLHCVKGEQRLWAGLHFTASSSAYAGLSMVVRVLKRPIWVNTCLLGAPEATSYSPQNNQSTNSNFTSWLDPPLQDRRKSPGILVPCYYPVLPHCSHSTPLHSLKSQGSLSPSPLLSLSLTPSCAQFYPSRIKNKNVGLLYHLHIALGASSHSACPAGKGTREIHSHTFDFLVLVVEFLQLFFL